VHHPAMMKTRKRRIVIAVAVFTGLVLVTWSLGSSRVDRRYVGKWIDQEGMVANLGADGHFSTTWEGETDDWGQRWWISGNRLVTYSPSPSQFDNAYNWLKYFVRRVTGTPQWNPFEDSLITKFDGETLQLDGELDLRRVPESATP
jgi:hypothetical protein